MLATPLRRYISWTETITGEIIFILTEWNNTQQADSCAGVETIAHIYFNSSINTAYVGTETQTILKKNVQSCPCEFWIF